MKTKIFGQKLPKSVLGILKKNGYRIFRKPGFINRKPGVFEIGVTKGGVIDHRFFRSVK